MYVTIQEVIEECGDGSPDRIKSAILLAQEYIEKFTGQWFESRDKTFIYDGKGRTTLYLPVFPISITAIEEDGVEIDSDDYYVYNRFNPDDRKNPKIVFRSRLTKGYQNISVNGNFGYVEEDSTTPLLIKKITKKLALTEIKMLSDETRRDLIDRGRVTSESTDGHSYSLSEVLSSGGVTGDPEIDQVLLMYKAPIKMGLA